MSTVAKSGKKPDPPPEPGKDKQINFRANARLNARLEACSEALGLDVSNFVRLVLNENLAKYERRVERMKQGLPADDDPPSEE